MENRYSHRVQARTPEKDRNSHRHTQISQPKGWKRLKLGHNHEVNTLDGVTASALVRQSVNGSSRHLASSMWRPMISRRAEVK